MTTCPCPLLAQSGHYLSVEGCPLLGVKRTSTAGVPMSANDPTRTSSSLPKPLRQWQAQAHEVSPHDDVAGNPTFFRCFLRVSFRRGPPGTLSGSGEILHDHFPDVVTIAVKHHSSAAKRRIRTSQGVLGRPIARQSIVVDWVRAKLPTQPGPRLSLALAPVELN